MEGQLRIGVYVCHCGLDIGSVVDCKKVAKYASELEDVALAKDLLYTCSDLGQEEIRKDIKEHSLNRIVVASCSPRLHEPTFRETCREAGLNPYLFEMANIREQCSWVHLREKRKATEKAKELVAMAVARARLLEPQVESEVPVTRKALVIGGGVAGIQASLDLADTSYKVYLVEKAPSIGGRMAQLDKTFPTMDCSICILGPKLSEVSRHPNIELLTHAELREVEGYVGNFKVSVLKKPRYVTNECTACNECVDACPVVIPNEFDLGLASRKAIYTPFPQAVPPTYIIDMDNCLGNQPIRCNKCAEVCEPKAIDLDQKEEMLELEVGTIIVATGMDTYDPSTLENYGYSKFENVITSLEFERLINAAGPSGGNLIKLTDRRIPRLVAFIQCVGSRSYEHGYCSNICCMNTVKDALLIKEHWPECEIHVFYTDLRAFGKGFEQLFKRSREEGVVYVRGKPGKIIENEKKNLLLFAENTLTGEPIELEAELVILSIGLKARRDNDSLQKLLTLSKNLDGFFLEAHPKLRPVDTSTSGVYLCGCAEAPKDIKESVTQASAAAGRAGVLLSKGKVKIEPITPQVDAEVCKSCGRCAEICPYHAVLVDKEKRRPAEVVEAACMGCGTCGAECPFDAIRMRHFTNEQILTQIDAATKEKAAEKIIAFCCNWCSYAGADLAGTSRIQYPPNVRIIRTMCSGRVDKKFILHAFKRGAGVVLVSGCHLGDCHYMNANYHTKTRIEKLWKKLDKLGIDKTRLQLAWISADEGEKFAHVIKKTMKILKEVTPEQINHTKKMLA